jgi:hypothetical protein
MSVPATRPDRLALLRRAGVPSPHFRFLERPDDIPTALDGFERSPHILIVGGTRDGELRTPAKVADCVAEAEGLLADDRASLVLIEALGGERKELRFLEGDTTPMLDMVHPPELLQRIQEDVLAPLRETLGGSPGLRLELVVTPTGPRCIDFGPA